MKAISITCILAGAFIFAAPMIHQLCCFALVAYALANTYLPTVNLTEPGVDDGYRHASMACGILVMVAGIAFGILNLRRVSSLHQEGAPPLARSSTP